MYVFLYITSSERLKHDGGKIREVYDMIHGVDFRPQCFAEKKHRRRPMSAGGDVRGGEICRWLNDILSSHGQGVVC
jgi:hypothetical protein